MSIVWIVSNTILNPLQENNKLYIYIFYILYTIYYYIYILYICYILYKKYIQNVLSSCKGFRIMLGTICLFIGSIY